MSLRNKTLLTVFAVVLFVILVLYGAARLILLDSFIRLEENYARKNLDRILFSINQNLEAIDQVTVDWAYWDDTYRYVNNANSTFIENNMMDVTFENMHMNLAAIFNIHGELVYLKEYDVIEGVEVTDTRAVQDALARQNVLLTFNGPDSRVSGIIMLPSGPILVDSRPILSSYGEGPIAGAFIFGRYLQQDEIDEISQSTGLPFSIYHLNDPNLPADAASALPNLAGEQVYLQVVDKDHLAGYRILDDLSGNPVLLLQMVQPREIYQYGSQAINYFVLALLGVGVLSTFVFMNTLENHVLNRLGLLSRKVLEIGRSKDLSQRIHMAGRDELSIMAASIDQMLARLDLANRSLQESEGKFRILSETSAAAIFIIHDGHFQYVNPVARSMFDLGQKHPMTKTLWDVLHPEYHSEIQSRFADLANGDETSFCYEIKITGAGGNLGWAELSASLIEYQGIRAVIGTAYDITERKQVEERLRYISTHDILSGLYNRTFFEEELSRLEKGRQFPLTIILVDIDNMKRINDSLGHAAGDELIRRTGQVMRSAFRVEDIVARIGGDEFAVILPAVAESEVPAILERIRACQLLSNKEAPGLVLDLSVGASTGLPGCTLTSILHQADERMYRHKVEKRQQARNPDRFL